MRCYTLIMGKILKKDWHVGPTVFTQIENVCIGYCWMLHREEPQAVHKRKSSKRSFEEKKRYYKDF